MNSTDQMIGIVQEMSDEKAKSVLIEIFNMLQNVGVGGYSQEKCYQDIRNIYKGEILRPQIPKI